MHEIVLDIGALPGRRIGTGVIRDIEFGSSGIDERKSGKPEVLITRCNDERSSSIASAASIAAIASSRTI